ncbi:uncharacterized protein METZ01_LOCUS479392, partial [marine metagenome]
MRILMLAVFGLGLSGVMVACGSTSEKPAPAKHAHACCEAAEAKDGWCGNCNIGFVGGASVKCQDCHTAKTTKGGW